MPTPASALASSSVLLMAARPYLPSENVEILTTAAKRASRESRTRVGEIAASTDIQRETASSRAWAAWPQIAQKTPQEQRAIRNLMIVASLQFGLRGTDIGGHLGIAACTAKNILAEYGRKPDAFHGPYEKMREAELAARTQPRRKPPRKPRKWKAVTPQTPPGQRTGG